MFGISGLGLGLGVGFSAAPLVLASVSPNYGSTGATRSVVITKASGPNFTGSETVTVNGGSCAITGHTTTTLTVTVPSGVARGIGDVVVNAATLAGGYFAMAMVFWGNVGLSATQSGGKITTMADQSGAGITGAYAQGTSANQPLYTASDFGTEPGATFAESSSTILIAGNGSPFSSGANKQMAVFAIAKHTNPSSDAYKSIIAKSSSVEYYNLCTDNVATGKIQWLRGYGAGQAAKSNAACNDGTARSYAGTWDGTATTNNVILYVNGVAQTTVGSDAGTLAISLEANTVGGVAGVSGATPSSYLTGDIAEWFGEAVVWTPTEIAFLSNSALVGSPANLAGVP